MTKVGKIVVENGVKENLPGCPFLSGRKEGKTGLAKLLGCFWLKRTHANVCSAWRLAWSWQMARQNLSQAWTACLAILEEKQEVATQQKKARISCFHLLHQEFFLLGLDPQRLL